MSRPKLYRAMKHVGIGTICAGFERRGYNAVGKMAPILRKYFPYSVDDWSIEGFIEQLECHGFDVEEVKYDKKGQF